ncbi:hypothetical protein PB31_134 [Pseudomonas phage vB_PaeM_B31]|uniref:hypothetical protein n=1 Tax=Pseudomonas phage vB_PaeM_B31 TaxID=3022055 RepID=UPI002440FB96|nr:hypothetical protein QE333_gp134 [Pseudomonas phage vB_PaeM_B31]WBW49166.1 hypothetical protein PB31_134 [Pseudomonas phage vB_PaeM_B31]
MREGFEAWLLREHGLESEWQEGRNCFKDYPAHLAFKAWQASRAALRVELPAKRSYSMYATKHECHAFNDAIEKAKEALQKAGIKVK